jgi:hypothetical protein
VAQAVEVYVLRSGSIESSRSARRERPEDWLKIGDQMHAAELLAKRGVIEVWNETGLYRLKSKG